MLWRGENLRWIKEQEKGRWSMEKGVDGVELEPSGTVWRCARKLATSVIFFFQAEDSIRASPVTGVQTCALPILDRSRG